MRTHLLVLATVCLFASACATPRIFSPQIRTAPLQSAATVGEGHLGVQLAGSYPIFGDSYNVGDETGPIFGGKGRVRYGLSEEMDLVTEFTGTFSNNSVDPDPFDILALGGAVGVKYQFARMVAVEGILGGGASKAGGYLGPAASFIWGYENDVVVPFASLNVGLSVPVAAKNLRGTVPDPCCNENDPGTVDLVLRPRVTTTFSVAPGVRVPLGKKDEGVHGNLLFGFEFGWMTSDNSLVSSSQEFDDEDDQLKLFINAMASAEIVF